MKNCDRITATSLLASLLMGVSASDSASSATLPISQSSPIAVIPTQKPRNSERNRQLNLDTRLIEASHRFSFNLFDRIAKKQINKNIFISPLSISLALSMTYNGASGETQSAMSRTLEVQGIAIGEVNNFNRILQESLLNSDNGTEISIANSLWANKDFPLKQSFVDNTKTYYQAKLSNLDFSDVNAATIINDWVKQKTKGKISKIIEETDSSTTIILVNAIYFKSGWRKPFNKSNTKPKPFTLDNGTKIQHPAMSQTEFYPYLDTPEFQAVKLPYRSTRYSMDIFLPKSTSNLTVFQKLLTAKNWQVWSDKFEKREVFIQLPSFKIEYGIDLINTLQNMGMQIAFRSDADFSNLSAERAFINEVKHKTFVDVNEQGTEAAAVTSVGMTRGLNSPDSESAQMIIDRPFFFAISDRQTGTILFMGAIKNPSK
ncbi:serpin family protein [Pseudanabaena sp. BC1403]|uniref:serpin family protein n=1 Tax=Pseudanabaena sp. BC1403 TaxID=2043171 RepID=UPI000CD9C024|nr:serpin family protein [Pseudanabaena sp. BC1403]